MMTNNSAKLPDMKPTNDTKMDSNNFVGSNSNGPSAWPDTATSIIDIQQLASLIPRPHRQAAVATLIDRFLARTELVIVELHTAIEAQNTAQIMALTHKLAGGAASVGAALLAQTARELYRACIQPVSTIRLGKYGADLKLALTLSKRAYTTFFTETITTK